MQKTIARSVLGVQLALLIVGGLFSALGVNALLSVFLLKLTPATPVVVQEAEASSAEEQAQQQADQEMSVLQFNRNLFNQSALEQGDILTGAEDTEASAEGLGEELAVETQHEPPPGAPVPTDLKVLLVGTQVADDPTWSLAILKPVDSSSDGETIYGRVGTTLLEDATIFFIERNRVYFYRHSAGDRVEYIDIETTLNELMARAKAEPKSEPKNDSTAQTKNSQAGKGNTTPAKTSTAQSSPKVSSAGIDLSQIERGESGEYRIPKDMADYVRANPKALKDPKFGQPPQIQPVYHGGAVGGFRILGVQSSSVYSQLGIQNGDIIMNVNGQVVDNPQKALAFFDQLAPGQDANVKINRRGKLRTLVYSLK